MNVRDGFTDPCPLRRRGPSSRQSLRQATALALTLAAAAFSLHLYGDFAAFVEPVDARHHHFVARLETVCDFRVVAFRRAFRHLAHRHRGIGLDQVDILSRCGALDRGRRDQRHALLLLHQEVNVHELLREQHLVLVGKRETQPNIPGGGIDLVIDGRERSGPEFAIVGAVPYFRRQLLSGVPPLENLRQIVLGHREHHSDRLNLRDHHQAVRVGGMNDVARVHQAQSHTAGDLRRDMAIDQIQFRSIDRALIGLHRADQLVDQRFLGGALLFGNGVLLQQ